MDTIIAILLFLIGLVVVSCGIIASVWWVKRRRALAAAAGQAQVPAGAAVPPQGQVPPAAVHAANGGAPVLLISL